MTASLDRVLIPVEVSESLSLGGALIDVVPMRKAVLLGYWPIPDQSISDQVREQFEEEAQRRLQTIANRFSDQGVSVQTRLVFTKDRDQLIETATNKYECQSVLIPGTESPPSGTTRGIVLVKPDADLDRIVTTHCWTTLAPTPNQSVSMSRHTIRSHRGIHDAERYSKSPSSRAARNTMPSARC